MIAFRFIYELWQKERADILNVTMQDDYVPVLLLWLIINNNVVKEFWRKAASPFYHPLQRRIGFFRRSDLDRRLIRVSLRSHESAPKRHLDRFSRFTKRKNVTNGHTDTQTHRTTPSVAIGRILRTGCMRRSLAITIKL